MSGDLVSEKADPWHDRIDLICQDHDYRYRIVTGVPADRPEPPRLPEDGWTVVARLRVRAGSTGIASVDLHGATRLTTGMVLDHDRLHRDVARLISEGGTVRVLDVDGNVLHEGTVRP